MRVAVLGSTGMAGHVVAQYLEEQGYEVFRISRSERPGEHRAAIDVTDFAALGACLDRVKPDGVINCIGLLQKACESRFDLGVLINSYLPHWLEQKYRNTTVKVIHLSTDCVFSGAAGGYRENSLPDGITPYDRTKALGEIDNSKDLTFRMSIIGPDINPEGTGLFNWFMRQTGRMNGFGKVFWNGVTTIELAKAIDAAFKAKLAGLYHLVPAQGIDKCSLLMLFQKSFGKEGTAIDRVEEPVMNKSLVNTRTDFDFTVHNYPTQVEEMKLWVEQHRTLYPHYAER